MSESIRIWKINTSKTEIIDIIKSWLAISIAFTIVRTGLNLNPNFLIILLISTITIGAGFFLHEMAHKLSAQHYGCIAEYRSFDIMLILVIILSFLGLFFAAPGAVMIQGLITRKENGVISLAGPLTNYCLAIIFVILNFLLPSLTLIWSLGITINIWLGLFNMIPFGNFDGIKIFYWNKTIWVSMVIFGIIGLILF